MDKVIAEVVECVKANPEGQWNLQQLAKKTHMSYFYAARRFKEEVGEAFCKFVKRIRFEKAKWLLQNTDYKIKRIADMAGFDHTHFCNEFKARFGMTPKQYRTARRQ